ncbi:MAG TPA: DUF2330 domain-containing protein [Polyangiaceae bacterium]|jgi:hypothetical protein
MLVTPRAAEACGGCFSPPKEVTVVTDHRMAFAVSPQQTVLWDQIEYSGAPQDFAWVLPVMPGAQVQLSHDQFFAALNAMTDPVITGPTAQCGSGGGVGCGGSASAGSGAYEGSGGGVQVVSQGVVGPYDTVTLHATDPNALYDWLGANSYDVPATIRPVIDAYVAGGFDFIALRLAPGQGVQAMQPVRVVSPGAALTLPLRMVAAGVGPQVGITLYVLSEGRYEARNFPNATFDDSKLVWLHGQGISNYEPLSESIMQGNGGRTWLTEFSQPMRVSLTCASAQSSGGVYGGTYYGGAGASADLGGLYYSSCQCAPAAGGAGASGDGGDSGDAGSTSPSDCASLDDLDLAFGGMDPSSVWVTRMRAILPSNALSEGDLDLQASAAQTAVSSQHTALVYDDPSYSPCASSGSSGSSASGGGGCSTGHDDGNPAGRGLVLVALGFVVTAIARRRRAA